MLPTATKLDFSEVPIVNLGPALRGGKDERAAVAAEIAEVCGRVGFFYIKDHGIGDADVEAIFATAREFHNLPLEARMEVSITKNDHGQGYLHGRSKGVHDKIKPNLQESFFRSAARSRPTIRISLRASRCTASFPGRAPCRASSRA